MKKLLLSVILFLLLTIQFSYAEIATDEEISVTIEENYNKALKLSTEMKNPYNGQLFNGKSFLVTYQQLNKNTGLKEDKIGGNCGTAAKLQLVAKGILPQNEWGGNGKQWYEQYKSSPIQLTPSYRYHVYEGEDGFKELLNQSEKNAIENVIISFSNKYYNGYGHVMFIHSIKDGNVYFAESFSAYGIKEGHMTKLSFDAFLDRYKNANHYEYQIEGAIHYERIPTLPVSSVNDIEILGIDRYKELVRIKNVSGHILELNNFMISTERDDMCRVLDNVSLQPNETITIGRNSADVSWGSSYLLNNQKRENITLMINGYTIKYTDTTYKSGDVRITSMNKVDETVTIKNNSQTASVNLSGFKFISERDKSYFTLPSYTLLPNQTVTIGRKGGKVDIDWSTDKKLHNTKRENLTLVDTHGYKYTFYDN